MCCTQNCHHQLSCLSLVPVFQGMLDKELETLQAVTKSSCYKKGEFIFREGESSDKLFIVHEGLIKLTKLNEEGKEQIIRLLFSGDFFGQFALLQNSNHYANAVTLEQTTICSIEKQTFLHTLEKNPTMALHFINALNNRLFVADEWMSLLSLTEVEKRLARIILQFLEKGNIVNNQFRLPISKKDLAALIGTTPETLSRKLLLFTEQKIIAVKQHRDIQVINLHKLKDLAGLSID
ncbi:Crp/Fnr family transcriptional regulator [Schinkia sp. CFF1]